jgi:FdhE protein
MISQPFESWDTRIKRANELVLQAEPTAEILTFYLKLLRAQKEIDQFLRNRRGWLPSGSLAEDHPVLRECLPTFLRAIEVDGSPVLAAESRRLLSAPDEAVDEMLFDYWHQPSDTQFFAKAFLQPYLRWLAESGGRPCDRTIGTGERGCPFCGGMPQVSFLQIKDASAESGNRDLVCASCTVNWSFKRVACPYCGEEQPTKLGYFHTPEYDHIRIEACDTCRRYIKGVDLTRLGFAVPLVDEVAGAALDVWASEHNYEKIELNLIGL